MLKLPREAIFIQDKLSSAAGTNIVHHASCFDKQGEGGGPEAAFKHLLLPSTRWFLSSRPLMLLRLPAVHCIG